jgi:5-methylcytosine-specific restriction protein A
VTGFSRQVRAVVIERAHGYCERCGEKRGTEAHHRRARGAGGTRRPSTNQPSNALWLCAACHRDTESRRTHALANGWLVRQHDEPRDAPVLYRGTRVWLDDLGCMHDNPQHAEAAS